MILKRTVVEMGIFLSLFNLLTIAAIGLLLRFHKTFPLSWLIERNWMHAHSHGGFLGWAFIALFITAFALNMPDNSILNRRVFSLIVSLQVSVLGMLAIFPFTGYGLWSILFSTVHMVISAGAVALYFKNTDGRKIGVLYMRAAMVFYLISGIGPLSLGPMMAAGMKGTELYDMAVYFYLHFQYNGWFVLAIFGLIYSQADIRGITFDLTVSRWNLAGFILTIILTLGLSSIAFDVPAWIIWTGFGAVALQVLQTIIISDQVFNPFDQPKTYPSGWARLLTGIALITWSVKLMLQMVSGTPEMFQTALIRDSIMFYLHLTFLGMLTCFIFGTWIQLGYFSIKSVLARWGIILFLFGIIFSEIAVGLKVFVKYFTFEFYSMLNPATLTASSIIFIGIAFMVAYGFIAPLFQSKQQP